MSRPAKGARRKAGPKARAPVEQAPRRGILRRVALAAAWPFRAIARGVLARLTEVSSGVALSGGLANYVMILSCGGTQAVALASLGLCAVPALLPDGTLSFKRSRRAKR